MSRKSTPLQRRKWRVRARLSQAGHERPRLSVHRTSQHIYAQIIDDVAGRTLVAASTLDKDVKGEVKTGADTAAAAAVGKLVGERALAAGVTSVKFDRGAFLYHGRIKALADAARDAGLSF